MSGDAIANRYVRKEGKSYAQNVFNVSFDAGTTRWEHEDDDEKNEWVFNDYSGWDDLHFPKLECGDMTFQWIVDCGRMFTFTNDAFDAFFSTKNGGLGTSETSEDMGYMLIKDETILSGLTTQWAKYGAGTVRDAAKAVHDTHEALLASRAWMVATEEAQGRLDMIQRYGGVPGGLDVESSDNQWLKLSQDDLASLCRDLRLTNGHGDPSVMADVREAFGGFSSPKWKSLGGGTTYTQYHGVAPCRDGDTHLVTKSGRYGSYLTKQGLVTLLKAFLNRKDTHAQNEAAFKEAAVEYVKQCKSEEGNPNGSEGAWRNRSRSSVPPYLGQPPETICQYRWQGQSEI